MKRSFLILAFLLAGPYANAATCTAINQAAITDSYGNPRFQSITNGLEGVSGGILPNAYSLRAAWTSDASTTTPASQQRVLYATAAEWAVTPSSYPHVFHGSDEVVSSSTTPQALSFSGLLPNTLYHFQPQSLEGGTWCTNLDLMATTPASPGIVYPIPPKPVTNITGIAAPLRTRTVNVSAGCTGATNEIAFQNCLTSYLPGDAIVIPHGMVLRSSSSFNVPISTFAKVFTVTLGPPDYFTCPNCSAWLANGQHVAVGTDYYYPGYTGSGLGNESIFKVINVGVYGTNTFNLSADGTNIQHVNDSGLGNLYIARYPQDLIDPVGNPITVIESDGVLPPEGVRLDTTTYASQLATLEKDGNPGQSLNGCGGAAPDACPTLQFGPLASNWRIIGLKFTTNDITIPGETIPLPFDPSYVRQFASIAVSPNNYGVVVDRSYITSGPAPNSVGFGISHAGSNGAVINSVIAPVWESNIGRFLPNSSASGNVLNINGTSGQQGYYSYPVGHICSVSSVKSLTFTGNGTFAVYLDTNCVLTAQLQTGLTATGVGFTIISTTSAAAYPVDSYTRYIVLPIVSGSVSAGVITFYDFYEGELSGIPLYITANQGPFLAENNYITWRDIGIFSDTGAHAQCGPNCQPLSGGSADITLRRNDIEYDSGYYNLGSNWNGWGGANHTGPIEFKSCLRCKTSGNLINVSPANFSLGMCIEHVSLDQGWPAAFVNQAWNSEWEDAYNTCLNSSTGFIASGDYGLVQTYSAVMKDFWLHDNLMINNFFNSQWSPQASLTYLQGTGGFFLQNDGLNEEWIVEHNADYFRAGNAGGNLLNASLPFGNFTLRNNFLSYLGLVANWVGNYAYGAAINNECSQTRDQGTLTCPADADWKWQSNYALPTYGQNGGDPLNYNEMPVGNSPYQTGWYQNIWPTSQVVLISSNTSPMSARTSSVGWFKPDIPGTNYTPLTADLRLKSSSPYISGGKLSTDGLDIGPNVDKFNAEQGKVFNVHVSSKTSTSAVVAFLAPDSFACGVDWSTNGFSTWTRVSGAIGSVDPRVQTVTLSGLPAHGLISYKVNCAVQQPIGTIQLP